jgi:hypothetical protein
VLNSGRRSFKLSAGDHFTTIAIVHYTDTFRENFGAIERGDVNENTVLRAIEAAFAIGTLAPTREVDRKRLARQAELSNAEKMRTRKKERDAERAAKLIEAINALQPNKNCLATSQKYAEKIRPCVIEQLKLLDEETRDRLKIDPERNGWPSASTIKNAIREIKSVNTSRVVLT